MAFVIEVSSIRNTIDGQNFSLTIRGVKAYNLDNIFSRKGSLETFKVFIGFQVKVCTNLCVWSDGYSGELKVTNTRELKQANYGLIEAFDAITALKKMSELQEYSLTEQQFAQLISRCRMYKYLPSQQRIEVPELLLGEGQLGMVVRDYYKDNSFCRGEDGSINLWRLYNLLTSANRQTYIDQFLDRNLNAGYFVAFLQQALKL